MGPPSPPPPPTAEQAMIASLQLQIGSLEGVINALRRELAEWRGEPAPAQSPAAPSAPAATTMAKTTTAAKKAAPATRAAPGWQLQGGGPNRCPRSAQAQQTAAPPQQPPPLPPAPRKCGRGRVAVSGA